MNLPQSRYTLGAVARWLEREAATSDTPRTSHLRKHPVYLRRPPVPTNRVSVILALITAVELFDPAFGMEPFTGFGKASVRHVSSPECPGVSFGCEHPATEAVAPSLWYPAVDRFPSTTSPSVVLSLSLKTRHRTGCRPPFAYGHKAHHRTSSDVSFQKCTGLGKQRIPDPGYSELLPHRFQT